MQTTWKIINWTLILGIVAVGALLLASMAPVPGNWKVKIVKSGSMEPTIKTGGIVVIKPTDVYRVGDIVTFGADTKTQIPTTHRIIEMGDFEGVPSISTKGDANDSPDQRPTPISEIHGKVILTVPYLGFLLDFAKKPIGFALLVGLPALAIIVDELGKIVAELRKMRKRKERAVAGEAPSLPAKEDRAQALAPGRGSVRTIPARVGLVRSPADRKGTYGIRVLALIILPSLLLTSLSSIGSTISYLSDVEVALSSYIKADPLGFALRIDGEAQIDVSGEAKKLTVALVPDADSEPIQYDLSTYMTEGDPSLCGVIEAEVTGPLAYHGPLLLLSTETTTSLDPISFTLGITEGYAAAEGASCSLDLIVTGRNANAGIGEGYRLTRRVSLVFYSPVALDVSASAPRSALIEVPAPPPSPDEASSEPTPPQPPLDEVAAPETETPPPSEDATPASTETLSVEASPTV